MRPPVGVLEQTLVVLDPVKCRVREYNVEFPDEIQGADVQLTESQIAAFLGQRGINHALRSVDTQYPSFG